MPKNPLPGTYYNGLSNAARTLAPTAVLIRILPRSRAVTHFYGVDFERLPVDRSTDQKITQLIRQRFASIADWRYAHDFHIPTGRLYLTPDPAQRGYVPEDDRSFGTSSTRYIATADGVAQ